MVEIPLGLRTAIDSGTCVLFLGAGIGDHVHDTKGNPAPDAASLARSLADGFSLGIHNDTDLSKVAGIVELRHGRVELEAFLQKRLAGFTPDPTLQWLFKLRWAAIFTTNYNETIERAYELIPNPPQKPVIVTLASEIVRHDPRFEVPIYHLHGALFGSQHPNILITEDDYSRFREKRRMLFELLKIEFARSPILYIAYSNRDPNWKILINEISAEFYPAQLPQSYRVDPNTDPIDDELLRAKNITSINCSYQQFQESASLIISSAPQESSRYRTIEKEIPPDLIPAFEKNPAPTARLFSSWEYINQAPFHGSPNVQEFVRGNRPNWALVGSRELFERDIEEPIYDELLDFATSSSNKSRAILVLAPAGYGVTTTLMTLASRLVMDRAGPTLMLRPGSIVLEGDVEYATTLFENKLYFFINNATDHSTTIHTMLHRLEDLKRPAMFVLGEHLNEWRQGHGKLSVKEYQMESLSDPEIYRLIDFLAKHDELGVLSNLSRDMQYAVIKQKHGKELLVALREATEGKSFDAILEDEFRGINNATSRRLYLTVCCFHQHGALVRDTLLSQILETPLTELYERTADSTEGIVIYECVDAAGEAFAARTRHSTIAAVVWERCAALEEKNSLLRTGLNGLNLNYSLDKSAFESFIRSDRTIDQIRTLDGKIRFFETACKKDPDSPYVRQHYARMLLREGKVDLALGQIDQALSLDSNVRVLHHTRGMVLMQLALTADSNDIGRRRLAQSEACFRRGIAIYPRDEYCFQGLAQLYIGWAKKLSSSEEFAEYITKAEGVIDEGLRQVRVRDSLWIESSNIQSYLGNQPSCIQALEKAVEDSPGSIVPRYLLGRSYRRSGRIKDAIDILFPVIRDHPNEFRSFVEYGIAIAQLHKSYNEAIAILKISTLYGYSDPRFIATLGGMLFMSSNFTEAKTVFDEALKREFSSIELNTIEFHPLDFNDASIPVRMKGRVILLRAGYAIVESEGFPPFLCPGSKFNGLLMNKNMHISFEPAFSAKGALAINPLSNGTEPNPK